MNGICQINHNNHYCKITDSEINLKLIDIEDIYNFLVSLLNDLTILKFT